LAESLIRDVSDDRTHALRELDPPFPLHIVIDEDHQRKRKTLIRERNNILFDSVVEHVEITLEQPGHKSPPIVLHRNANDEIGFDSDLLLQRRLCLDSCERPLQQANVVITRVEAPFFQAMVSPGTRGVPIQTPRTARWVVAN
jgi:hypothetical protein